MTPTTRLDLSKYIRFHAICGCTWRAEAFTKEYKSIQDVVWAALEHSELTGHKVEFKGDGKIEQEAANA